MKMLKLPYPLILASSSPRRKDILEMMGLEFRVEPSQYQEPSHSEHLSHPEVFAQEVAIEKGKEVFERFDKKNCVLSADTLGYLGEHVLEKPKDREDAKRMLQLMSGKEHIVLTSVVLFSPSEELPQVENVSTTVTFKHLLEKEIDQYLDEAEYMDKAAAYAIQGKAAVFVEKIEGDFFNVVGLPIKTVWEMLKKVSPNI